MLSKPASPSASGAKDGNRWLDVNSFVDVLDEAAVIRHQTVTTILPICWFDSR